MFAEGAARVVAEEVLAEIKGREEPHGYDGRGSCYIEFGGGQIGLARLFRKWRSARHASVSAGDAQTPVEDVSLGTCNGPESGSDNLAQVVSPTR